LVLFRNEKKDACLKNFEQVGGILKESKYYPPQRDIVMKHFWLLCRAFFVAIALNIACLRAEEPKQDIQEVSLDSLLRTQVSTAAKYKRLIGLLATFGKRCNKMRPSRLNMPWKLATKNYGLQQPFLPCWTILCWW